MTKNYNPQNQNMILINTDRYAQIIGNKLEHSTESTINLAKFFDFGRYGCQLKERNNAL